MINKDKSPLRITVVGMGQRTQHMLQLFFEGPCKNNCVIADAYSADISMVDMDVVNAQSIYEEQRVKFPSHRFIVLSLENKKIDDAYYVAKPIKVSQLLAVLTKLRNNAAVTKQLKKNSVTKGDKRPSTSQEKNTKVINPVEKVTTADQPARRLDEKNAISYIGSLRQLDLSDPVDLKAACYKPKGFLQGYVEHAFKLSLMQNKIIRLDNSWKAIIICPEQNKVLIDADDKQLQAACRIKLDVFSSESGLGLSTLESIDDEEFSRYHVVRMDVFLWQIALWTSQGRFPEGLDLNQPVFLREWPNMTRLLLFPNAMRIAALMKEQPRTLVEIASLLNVPQQYVFAFYSAAHSAGIASQATRQVDSIVEAIQAEKPKKRGLFSRILDRLKST